MFTKCAKISSSKITVSGSGGEEEEGRRVGVGWWGFNYNIT